MRLLVLANVVPYPPHGGIHARIFNLLRRVARRHDVTLGCHSWGEDDQDGAAWLTRNGIRTLTGRVYPADWRRHAAPALRALVAGRPPEVAQYQAAEVRALVARERFDIVQVEETILAPYATSLPRAHAARTLIVFHNVHFVQEQRIARLEPTRRERLWRRANAAMMRRYEPAVAARFDRAVAVSDADAALLRAARPGLAIDVLPNGVDTALRPLPPPQGPPTLVFVGTLNYRPCADAVVWLVETILPRVRRQIPDCAVAIVGKLPPPEVLALAGPGVTVTGYVPDVAPYYQRATLAVAPLRAGGGSRLKILEAMAFGRPVVSTTIGAEGLHVADGENILLADAPEAFAAAIARLLGDAALAGRLARAGRRFVEAHHDWDTIAARQLDIYDEMMASAR
jgi:glycosyltransferase involved in cell wall biosynthesis